MPAHFATGTYRVRIVAQGFVDSEYGTQFSIIVGVPTMEGDEFTRTVFLPLLDADGNRATFSNGEDAASKTLDAIRYLGFPEGEVKLSKLDPAHTEHHSFVGQEIMCYCQVKDRDGDTVERWYINVPRTNVLEEQRSGEGSLKKLDAMFGQALKGSAKKPKAKPKPASKPAQEPAPEPEAEPPAEDEAGVPPSDGVPF
jgi:hypothetical protein